MSRKLLSLALLTAITLISLVGVALAGDRSPSRDIGRNPPSRIDPKPEVGRRPPSRDVGRNPPSRVDPKPDVGRKPPGRDIGRNPPSRGALADAGPRFVPFQQRDDSLDMPNTVRRPVVPRVPAADKESRDKPKARDNDADDKKANPGFTGQMLLRGGFEVTGVVKNGPADAAGLQVGDVVNSANGIALRTFNDAKRAVLIARGVLTLDVIDVNTGAAARRVVRF